MVETQSAKLMNPAGKVTLHRYVKSELVEVPGSEKGKTITGTAHIFECTETGAERRWGFDR